MKNGAHQERNGLAIYIDDKPAEIFIDRMAQTSTQETDSTLVLRSNLARATHHYEDSFIKQLLKSFYFNRKVHKLNYYLTSYYYHITARAHITFMECVKCIKKAFTTSFLRCVARVVKCTEKLEQSSFRLPVRNGRYATPRYPYCRPLLAPHMRARHTAKRSCHNAHD